MLHLSSSVYSFLASLCTSIHPPPIQHLSVFQSAGTPAESFGVCSLSAEGTNAGGRKPCVLFIAFIFVLADVCAPGVKNC